MNTHYKNLEVWERSMKLAETFFQVCETLPKSLTYNLSDQMKRASLSIPSNIAEWMWRSSNAELIRFLTIARGSAMELETQVILSYRLGHIWDAFHETITGEIETVLKLLSGFIRYKRSLTDSK